MPVGCVYTHPLSRKGICIHIGVGFEVAYLSELGKFDGLKGEISNECEPHAFFVCVR